MVKMLEMIDEKQKVDHQRQINAARLTIEDDLPELDFAPALLHLSDELDTVEVGMEMTKTVPSSVLQRYTVQIQLE